MLAVYDHWLARRRQVGGPLLSTLWFQQPWKVRSSCVFGDGGDGDLVRQCGRKCHVCAGLCALVLQLIMKFLK